MYNIFVYKCSLQFIWLKPLTEINH